MKTRVKTIEWQDDLPAHAKGATSSRGYIDLDEIAWITATKWTVEGEPIQYQGGFSLSAGMGNKTHAGTLEEVKAAIQAELEKWWTEQVARFTEPAPYEVVAVIEGPTTS